MAEKKIKEELKRGYDEYIEHWKKEGRCRKCGSLLDKAYKSDTTLVGGFHTMLCSDCLNDWRDHVRPTQAWKDHCTARMRHDLLVGANGADSRAAELASEVCEIEDRLYSIAKAWMTSND